MSDDEANYSDEDGFDISHPDVPNRYPNYDNSCWPTDNTQFSNKKLGGSGAAGDSQSWQPITDYNRQGRGSFQTAAVDLRLAVESGDVSEVERLISSHNLDVNQPLSVPGGWSPAVLAASLGHVELLNWLLDKGAKLSTGPDLLTALMAVCSTSSQVDNQQGLRDCAALLLERGENVNASQRQRITALMLASKYGRIGLVYLLLEKGATKDLVDSQGWSALMFAVDSGHGDVARVLLETGADPDLLSSDGQRAADLAGNNSFPEIQDLVEHYSKEKALILSRSEKTGPSDHNDNSIIKKFTELENVLFGLDLHEYLSAFNEHKVGLAEFLLLEETDLIHMGIDKVGARKKLLEGQAEIHKQYWEKPSMPQVGIDDKRMGLRLSCPDATGMMSNMSSHARYLTTSVEFIRRQLHNHGERLLQVGGDLVSPHDLLQQTVSCETNLSPLLQEVKYLRRQLEQAGAHRKKAPVDMARKGGLGSDWRWVWKLGSGLVIAGAGVGVILYRKLR